MLAEEATGIEKAPVLLAPSASRTVAVKEIEPAACGVPLNAPAGLKVSPVGNPLDVHWYGVVPPDAANWAKYGLVSVAPGSTGSVVMTSGGGATVRLSVELPEFKVASVAVTVKL